MERKLFPWKPLLLLLAVLLVVFYVVMAQSRQQVAELSTESSQLQQTYAELDQENKELNDRLNYVKTDAYVEEVASNVFHYLHEGEVRFRFSSIDVLRGYTAQEYQLLTEELRN